MTLLSEQCGYVLRGLIVSREGFERNDGCEVLQEKLSQWWGSPHYSWTEITLCRLLRGSQQMPDTSMGPNVLLRNHRLRPHNRIVMVCGGSGATKTCIAPRSG
jgi:hypothetical protein